MPRSRWKTMTAIDISQTMRIGPRSRRRGKRIPRNFLPDHRERVAPLHEVAGEEDRQRDLRDLARLEAERADGDPHACAVDLLADAGKHRQQQKDERHEPEDVGVALQDAVVADDQHDADRADDRDRAPDDLADARAVPAGVAVMDVDAVDHRDAEPVEHGRDRQQERVGLRRDVPQRDVHPEDEDREAEPEVEEREIEVAECAELDEADGRGVDRARHDQQDEFEIAQLLRHPQPFDRQRTRRRARRVHETGLATVCWHRSTVPRSAWPNSECRR